LQTKKSIQIPRGSVVHTNRKRKAVRVTRIYYVHTPDAELRLSRALDMLLEGMTWGSTDHKDSAKNYQREKSKEQ